MDAYKNIISRQSYRVFKNIPIEKEVIKKVIEAAGNSPSYTNTQPWDIAIVFGKKKKELIQILLKLERENSAYKPDIPFPKTWPPEMENRSKEHNIRRAKTFGNKKNGIEENLVNMNLRFYDAPCVVFLFMENSLKEWSLFDMGLFAQNLVLAAHSLGVGTCIQALVTKYASEIKRFLNITKDKKLITCIPMGYPEYNVTLNKYRSIKKNINEFTLWYE